MKCAPKIVAILALVAVLSSGANGVLPALSALAAAPTPTPAAQMTETVATPVPSGASDQLIAAAKAEGSLSVIALPRDWCNYADVIDSYKAKYGLQVTELNPQAGSADEIEAIKANKDNKGPQAPDVIDVGLGFGPQAAQDSLVQPYKVSVWDTIPDSMKDANGYWYGDYYGVMAFEVNKAVVQNTPQDWSDLLKPEYKGQVALAGDPRASNQAIQAIYAAALATGGSLDNAMPGLEFMKKLNEAGNFVPLIANQAPIAKGESPIVPRWDYLALADKKSLAGNPEIDVVVPKSGIMAGVYVQAISAYAPHPNAAKLWMEYIYSDEGQLLWLKGFCHPSRYNDLVKRNVVPADLAAQLPPAAAYQQAVFATVDQLNAAKQVITQNWDKVVGVDVK
jgi:putative spermidine/putrescine transport system substrate-binding protein